MYFYIKKLTNILIADMSSFLYVPLFINFSVVALSLSEVNMLYL